jgi:hypothetical protein
VEDGAFTFADHHAATVLTGAASPVPLALKDATALADVPDAEATVTGAVNCTAPVLSLTPALKAVPTGRSTLKNVDVSFDPCVRTCSDTSCPTATRLQGRINTQA